MTRECHVRFSEGVGVGFPSATRLSASLRSRRRGAKLDWSISTAGVRIRALTTEPRIKPTSIFLRSARRPNPGRGSTYRRGIIVQTTGTGSTVGISRIDV
jgi:hypothetical protein